jgi:homocysteine S-methyltransferase
VTALTERLGDQVLVGDGGLGSMLMWRVRRLRCAEEANLIAPETVLALHLEYIRAGADVIQTNTYGANKVKLADYWFEDRSDEVTTAAVKIAREAREVSGRNVLIAGSIGPLGTSVEHIGAITSSGAALYGRQASVLAARGVDFLMLETFTSLDELIAAAEAVKSQTDLPVVAQITVQDDGRTVTGTSAGEVGRAGGELGLAAVGVNCSMGPQSALEGLRQMAESATVPLTIQPNVGLPSYQDGRVLYPDGSEAYAAEFCAQAMSGNARLIGGCCGTQPHHIAAIRRAVDERLPAQFSFARQASAVTLSAVQTTGESLLARRLEAGEWVTSVELDPPKGANLERLLDVATHIHETAGVEFFDVNDNPMARARMSSLMTSAVLQQQLDVEVIAHLTPRDATSRGLESQLLGAHATGIRNLLAITGDYPPPGDGDDLPVAPEFDAVELVGLITSLNEGADRGGRQLDGPTSFTTGVALNPTADDLDHELARLDAKVRAGATFAMTQVLFDLAPLRELLVRLDGHPPVPIIVGLWPVTSHALALRLHHEVPGITIPEPILDRLKRAEPAAAREGVAIARSLLAEAREIAAGAYLVAPFGQPERVLDVLA